jgi:cytochrome oxidase Cu insertion factor (SCO1/SenC/PrrC family)
MTTRINAMHQVLAVALLATTVASGAVAQAPAAAAPSVPAVGSVAPEFTLPGATRYGTLAQPVKLSDFRGKTVVLAFFFQARTKG